MQAAAARPAGVQRLRRTDRLNAIPHLRAVDDLGLLAALPIAAAIIERTPDGALRVDAHNERFVDAVKRSTCTATDWNDADCLKSGPIGAHDRAVEPVRAEPSPLPVRYVYEKDWHGIL